MGLGEACRAEGNEAVALLEFRAARSVFEQVGAKLEAVRSAQASDDERRDDLSGRQLEVQPAQPGADGGLGRENVFRREGDYWSVEFEGHTVRLRNQKGMHYLAHLLAEPGREFHVLDLVMVETDGLAKASRATEPELSVSAGLDAGPLLDAEAKESYRRRLVEIEEDIEEARAMGNSERTAQAESERDFLVHELAHAFGLSGRNRRASSSSERARVSVTRAIRQAMARIRGHNLPLGEHLDRAIRTGTYCSYSPDSRVPDIWKV
jgi:hypothetical protein